MSCQFITADELHAFNSGSYLCSLSISDKSESEKTRLHCSKSFFVPTEEDGVKHAILYMLIYSVVSYHEYKSNMEQCHVAIQLYKEHCIKNQVDSDLDYWLNCTDNQVNCTYNKACMHLFLLNSQGQATFYVCTEQEFYNRLFQIRTLAQFCHVAKLLNESDSSHKKVIEFDCTDFDNEEDTYVFSPS
jgi:hypothetical protein